MQADPDATCEACGCHGAFRFEGETLCGDCYAGRGSCCSAEFSGRTPEDEETERPAERINRVCERNIPSGDSRSADPSA